MSIGELEFLKNKNIHFFTGVFDVYEDADMAVLINDAGGMETGMARITNHVLES